MKKTIKQTKRAEPGITESKRAELSAKQALAWQEAIFEGSRDAIFITDVDSRLSAVNAAACQLTGYSREELLKMRIPDLHEEVDLNAYRTYHDPILAGEETVSEAKILRKDGSKVDTEFNNRRIVIEGKPFMHTTARDITERKRAEEESRRANALVEEAHRELQQAFAREQDLARTDALTGVNNRRYWFELVEHEFEVAARYHHPLSVILFDIDHFKRVNDTFGHAAGDQILERVAQVARAALRSVDVIGRYGGEEFVIVLPVTTAPQAYPVAERIRAGVAAIKVETDKGQAAVTLSIGIAEKPLAEHPGGDDSVERVIQRADEAMYAAKAAGRNRTSIYSAPAEHPGVSA